MFIQTEATPNPATLKFIPGQVVVPQGTVDFREAGEAAGKSPLAERLFAVDGVTGVFFGYDFVTITKSEEGGEWQHMKPAVLGAIMEHFTSGRPVMAEAAPIAEDDGEEFFEPEDADIVNTIKELLEARVRPAVARDGGDITFRGFKDGTVFLNMRGACAGCPSSTATLKHGIQNLLRHFIPEVEEVEAVAA
ncbi:MAG: NifU family protein [Pseudomonadota bacterium]